MICLKDGFEIIVPELKQFMLDAFQIDFGSVLVSDISVTLRVI